MVCMHASNVVDREFELWSGKTEDHKLLSLQCLKFKNNDWLALNQVNVSRVERHVYL